MAVLPTDSMENNVNTNTDLSFLNEKSGLTPGRIKDGVMFFVHHIHWFLICGAIGLLVAKYFTDRKPRIYASTAKIMLKMSTASNRNGSGAENAIMNGIAQSYYYSPFLTTINNEITIITSKTNMREVVEKLDLNVGYTMTPNPLRPAKDLYGESPVKVDFCGLDPNDYASLSLTLQKDSLVKISCAGYAPVAGHLRDTISVPSGKIVVTPTWFYGEAFFGQTIAVTHSSASDVAEQYRSAVTVSRDDMANTLLNLSIRDRSAVRAADVLNTVIDVYNEDAIRDKTQIIENTYDFINQRIAQLNQDLSRKEGQLASFKRANNIIDIGSLGQSSLANKVTHSEEAERLNKQLALAHYTQGVLNNSSDTSPILVAFDDEVIANEVSKYNEIAVKLGKYKKSGSTNNPMVVSLNSELDALRGSVGDMLSSYTNGLETRLGSARAAESAAAAEVQAVPMKQIYVGDIERMQEVKSALYLNLLSKREELLISQPSIEAAAKVIDEARVNRTPVAPDVRRLLIAGLLLGLIFPVIVMLLYRLFDTRVRFRSDIEKSTDVPFIGEIPSKKKKDTRDIVVVDRSRELIGEAFRLLRSNVSYMKNTDKCSTVFLSTSMTENSGKTFVMSNLASSFAIAGKKVAMVDLDLRKGTLTANSLGDLNHRGVSDYLAAEIDDINAIITADGVTKGVDLVTSGHLPPNPAELLLNTRLDVLIDKLRERYDFIFVDCVPANVVADSDIVKRVADTTLFIVRSGLMDKRDLPGLQYMYETHKYPNMGVILNGIEIKKRRGYGYGYGSGSGYGYGYGYGYSAKKHGSGYGYGYGYGNSE